MAIVLKTKIPGPRSQELMKARQLAVARGPSHATPIFVKSAKGALLEDVDGNTLIDFACGIGVTNVGHCPDGVVNAIREQASRHLHTSINVTPYESYIRVAEKLNAATPGRFAKKTLLVNSGAEAVENAVKIARAFTKRAAVVCFEHAFHGRTYLTMTLTHKSKPYKYGFAPFMGDVYRAPYPYVYRWPATSDADRVTEECFRSFEQVVTSQIGADQVAAVIIEPVLGEGGFVPAPASFMKRLREFCTANGIVFIADEIQTGFGRTGTLFASEQLGVEPDLITMAKGLGGGMPLSAVTGRAEMMDAPPEGGLGGTYSGSPVACAAALEVFKMCEDGKFLTRSRALGDRLHKKLMGFAEKFPLIGDVRGLGPMQALEFVKDRKTKEPAADTVKKILAHCHQNGVVTMGAGTFGNVIRFLVPLVISDAELDEGLAVLERAIASV